MKQNLRFIYAGLMLLLIILSRTNMIGVDTRDLITILLTIMLIFLWGKDHSGRIAKRP